MKLSADERDLVDDTTMYICIVGSLIYMTITRPDLSYAVGVVSQFMQTPRKPHLDVPQNFVAFNFHDPYLFGKLQMHLEDMIEITI